MNFERPMSRSEKISSALSKLTTGERKELVQAADGCYHGGDVLEEPLRSKAIRLELAYESTGRLRADFYKILQD